MYPAYTQLVAKWSSPSIGEARATGCGVDVDAKEVAHDGDKLSWSEMEAKGR